MYQPSQFISLSCILFCAIVGQLHRKHLPHSFRLFVIHAWISFAVEVMGFNSQLVFPGQSNHILFNVYIPIDFLLMLYAGQGDMGAKLRQFSFVAIAVFSLVFILSMVLNGPFIMANFAIICGGMIQIIRYFLVLLWNAQQPAGGRTTGVFLIAVSILLFYCCLIPDMSLMHYLYKMNRELATQVYYIIRVLGAVRYLGTGIGLLIISRAFRSNTLSHG